MNILNSVLIDGVIYEDDQVDLNLNKRVTFLTGHNGVGKSTLMCSLYEAFNFPLIDTRLNKRREGRVELSLSTGRKVSLKKIYRIDKLERFISSSRLPTSLFKEISKFVSGGGGKEEEVIYANKDVTIIGGRERGSWGSVFNHSNIGRDAEVTSILFMDEEIHSKTFSLDEDKLEKLKVLSSGRTLNKTLYLLMNLLAKTSGERFIYDAAERMLAIDEIYKAIDDLLVSAKNASDESGRAKIKGLVDLVRKDVAELKESISYVEPHKKLMDEVRGFFSQTNRDIFLDENKYFKLKKLNSSIEVEWNEFSKGEKTLLCLLIVAYLNSGKGAIFFLDEPDLSLHIDWQERLVGSLLRLAPDAQFIIATHSPALVGYTDQEEIINLTRD